MNAHLYRIVCNTVTQHDSDSSHVPGSTLQLKMGRTDAVCNLSRWRLPLCGWSRRCAGLTDRCHHRCSGGCCRGIIFWRSIERHCWYQIQYWIAEVVAADFIGSIRCNFGWIVRPLVNTINLQNSEVACCMAYSIFPAWYKCELRDSYWTATAANCHAQWAVTLCSWLTRHTVSNVWLSWVELMQCNMCQ